MPTLIPEFTHTPSRQNPATFSADMDSRLSEENSRIVAMNTQAGENNAAVVTTTAKAAEADASATSAASYMTNTQSTINNAVATATSSASTSATNAATSATQAQTAANTATAVVIPTAATYSYTQQDWRQSMMSKAEFNAVAAERRANRAGSGFDSFGANIVADNLQGIKVLSTNVNSFFMGSDATGSVGNIKECINGVVHKHYDGIGSFKDQIITLPPAPTVLPSTATLTQQQIDSGVIKHADASNSGLIVNGKFDTDTSGWTGYLGATLSVVSGRLRVTGDGISASRVVQGFTTVVGKKYIIEVDQYIGTASTTLIGISINSNGNTVTPNIVSSNDARIYLEFTATVSTTYLTMVSSTINSGYCEFDNVAVFPADAISRSDLPFIESWHEDISEKDFVYPLGNVQYLGTTGDCGTTAAASFAGAVTYSLFSDTWQADSALVGKGYVWSTLSDANKKAFVANPENNCYLDGDKVIQVRYRARVVMGLGDSWKNVNETFYDASVNYHYGSFVYELSNARVKPKGKNISMADLSVPGTSYYTELTTTNTMLGHFIDSSTANAYEGKCFALPIALVHRRNQGMMHPVYNPNGTKLASDSLPWYSTTVSFTSIADCFTDSKLLATSGYIGTTTGRADGIFYDQVHEGDITDLRMSSKVPTDYNRLIDKEFNRLVAATYRGAEGEWVTTRELQTSTNTNTPNLFVFNATSKLSIGDTIQIFSEFDSSKHRGVVTYVGVDYITVSGYLFNRQSGSYVIISSKSTRTKSNTLTHTDIIGSPANYHASWKQSGVSGVPLIVAEDGTSLLPTGTTGSDGLAVFKLSRKANATPLQVLKSTDSGATWTALTMTTHYTFSTTTNAITFTSGNIPLVAHLIRVTYQTHTNMAVVAVNSEVLAIGDVEAYSHYSNDGGQQLVCSLLGKVNSSTTTNAPIHSKVPLSSIGISPVSLKLGTYTYYSDNAHTQLSLAVSNYISGVVKVLPYLTRSNGKAYLQLVFKEMKYGSYAAPTVVTAASATYTINMTYKINIAGCALDGKVIQWTAATATSAIDWSLYDVSPTGVIYLLSSGAVYASARLYDGDSWGDDSKFNIVDNVSTTTDTNGATVLIGQKRVELPYFIGAAE